MSHLSSFSRRKFIITLGAGAAASPLNLNAFGWASNRVRLGLIGCGKRSRMLVTRFAEVEDCEFVAVSDPDTSQMDRLVKTLGKRKDPIDISGAKKFQDYRKLLDQKDIDAVVVATPNHWHALHTIHAMEAGKDVYVEKPVTHSVWEGEQLIAAEKKYRRVVAAGFQNRSDSGPIEGIRYVNEGNLGKIQSVHVCCFRNRSSIGPRLESPLEPPATCDYNLWLGPASDRPIFRQKLHYDWHWDWNTGNGDMGNQAAHEIDMACWVMGGNDLPVSIYSFGNRFGWNDAGQTPNIQTAWFVKNEIPCVIEVNDLKLSPKRNVPGVRDGIRVGMIVRCEKGELRGGRGGMYVVSEDGQTQTMKFPGTGGKGHQKNFIEAVRSGRRSDLRSQLKEAEIASAIGHLANVSLRTGSMRTEDEVMKEVGENAILRRILTDQSAQLKEWGIDEPEYRYGQTLRIKPGTRKVEGKDVMPLIESRYREEFFVPKLA